MSYFEGNPSVKVIDAQNKARRVKIEINELRESSVLIKSGLNPGDQLIVRSNKSLKEGEEVEIEKPQDSPSVKQ